MRLDWIRLFPYPPIPYPYMCPYPPYSIIPLMCPYSPYSLPSTPYSSYVPQFLYFPYFPYFLLP